MSDAVIVFLTQHSRFSAYVQQEIGYAAAQKKLIIPLVQQGLGSDALAMLNGKEYIQFDSRDPRGALDPLMDRLRQLSATKQVQQTQQSNAVLFALGLAIVLALASD